MIAYLRGTVGKVAENSLVLDVNGVGYAVICSARTINEAKSFSGVIHIFTVLNVREDSWTLYGFISEQERAWFNVLTSVQGVGGKVAIAILSSLSDEDIYNAFLTSDKSMFTRADGVGPKLAMRIVTELKEKVVGKISPNISMPIPSCSESRILSDVISALVNLGYQRTDILRVIASMQLDEKEGFDTLLKHVLARLSSGALAI
ncbi:MAG: Holliday junction branch migration protein RuvA [Holosporaceae bacterium]|jgi:Holliday junction DNA helicase RuvA|nr:Holliday junction branch migration protein RuvA [Holosporaceae bacterium]